MVSIHIEDVEYFYATDVIKQVGISRQTFWRWRHQGKIPAGHRHRNGRILFTSSEVEAIRHFANHIKPIQQTDVHQLKLFSR